MLSNIRTKWNGVPIQVKASASYTVCSVLQKGLSFLTLPLFTRLLTQEQYGQYTVYASWSSIFAIFITLYLAYGSLSKALVEFEDDRKAYLATIQNIVLALALVFLAIYLPLHTYWNSLLKLPTSLVLLMVAEIVGQFTIACWLREKQFQYRYKGVIAMTLSTSLVMPLLALFFVQNTEQRGFARIFGYALVSILVGGVLFVLCAIRGKGGLKKKYWLYALRFNIPLIPYYLSQVIFNQSDRLMIDAYCGTDKAGLYGLASNLALILNFVLTAINDSYVPWFYGKIKEGKERENRATATGIAGLMAFLLLGIIALAPELILLLGGEGYTEAMWVVPPVTMSLLLLFYSQLFINVEFYYESKSLLVWGSIGAALLNVVLNALLIPKFGFVAAGYTTLVSYIAFAVANYFTMGFVASKKGFDRNAFDLRALCILFLAFAALAFAATALYRQVIIRYAIIVVVLAAVAIRYKQVKAFVESVLKRK